VKKTKKKSKKDDRKINIVVTVNSDKGDKKPPREPTVLATLLIFVAACAITYGQFTGDYSPLKGLAESGKPIIEVATKIAKEKAA
jgi:hypothetical protein